MQVNRTELMNILESVRPGLASRQTHEQATHFIFTGKDVSTFNDRLCITYPFKTDFKCSVKAVDFYRWLSHLEVDNMNMAVDDNAVVVEAGAFEAGFTCVLDESHKVEKHIKRRNIDAKGDFSPVPDNFLEGIKLCMFSCSSDTSRSAMNCVYISGQDLISSDGMRLSWFSMNGEMPLCLIRARDLTELIKFPITQYLITDRWAHFKTDDGVLFSVKLTLGDYPDKKPHFEQSQKLKVLAEIDLPRDSIQKSLDATSIMVEDADIVDRHVFVEIEPGTLILSSERKSGMSTGWSKARIEIDYNGEPVNFKINPTFLHQILNQITRFSVRELKRAIFTRDNFIHIISFTPEARS